MKKLLSLFFIHLVLIASAVSCDSNSGGGSNSYINSYNVNLNHIFVSEGNLSPVFRSDVTSYSVQVDNSTSSIDITAEVTDIDSTLKINNLNISSGSAYSMALQTGQNELNITVTAPDSSTSKTYTVIIERMADVLSSDANLAGLSISGGTLSPLFSVNTTAYTAQVGSSVSSITVTPTVEGIGATVTVNNTAVESGTASGSVSLNTGPNTITVKVTAQDMTTVKTYTVTVTRLAAPSSDANLAGLLLSAGALSPVFVIDTISYTAQVPYSVSSITVTPVVEGVGAVARVNGTVVPSWSASGSISLNTGANTITVAVTAQDTVTVKTYTVTVTRLAAPGSDATLAGLSISNGTLSPVFAVNTTSYTAEVSSGISSVTVTPTAAGTGAAVTVNGITVTSGSVSGAVNLNTGRNVIAVIVTAQDGITEKVYRITVTRLAAPSADASLAGLSLSNGTLSAVFDPSVTSYTAQVPYSISSITVTPTASGDGAAINVNSTGVISGSASGAINLNTGTNTITVSVTAQDGIHTSSYTVAVTRLSSDGSNANLSNLILSVGSLSFLADTTSYAVRVAHSFSSIVITPTAAGVQAVIRVNGTVVASGTPSAPVSLNNGANTITVLVTAQDGITSKAYTLTVKRDTLYVTKNYTTTDGLGSNTVNNVFVTDTAIYTSTEGGLSVSSDGGTTWINYTTVNGIGHNSVNDVFVTGMAIYAATDGGLSVSKNSGETWINYPSICTVTYYSTILDVFVKNTIIYGTTNGGGLSISRNDGLTWTNYTSGGLPNAEINEVYITDSTYYAATGGGLSVSKNEGVTWTNYTTSNGLGGSGVYGVYVTDTAIYAATSGGLSVSSDDGITWKNYTTSNGLGSNMVYNMYVTDTAIYVATYYGLSVSYDSGLSWENYLTVNGLGGNMVYGVFVSGAKVYAATSGGLTILTDSSL